jgi:DNA-binding NtrC family response regulator
VLQDGEFSRLGSNKRVAADVRVIAATNRDLEGMLARSEFREDLYYRLRVIEIMVPPLRERPSEIPRLFEYFVDKYSKRYNRPEPSISRELLEQLQRHSWPGNVRELENVVKRFVILQDEALLQLDLHVADRSRTIAAAPAPRPEEAHAEPEAAAASAPAANGNGKAVSAKGDGQPQMTLAEAARAAMLQAERDLIIPTLQRVHWNRRKAAPLLGISYKTLLNKIKEHGIIQE